MNDQLYKDIILEHWQNPQNYGIIPSADLDAEENNPYCGDALRLTINLNDDKVADIAFSGEGCAISKAYASIFTEDIKDKSLSELRKLDENYVLELLGIPLTPTRTKCALLIYRTMKKVLKSKNNITAK